MVGFLDSRLHVSAEASDSCRVLGLVGTGAEINAAILSQREPTTLGPVPKLRGILRTWDAGSFRAAGLMFGLGKIRTP